MKLLERSDCSFVIVLFFSLLILFWRVIISGGYFIFGAGIERPFAELEAASRTLRSGRLLLWSPLVMCGYPTLAGAQAGVVYPLGIPLFFLFPTHLAYNSSLFIHQFLGGVFTYLYAQYLQTSKQAAFLAAVVFALGSFVVTHLDDLGRIQAMVWMPLTFILIEMLFNQKQPFLYSLLLGAVFGIQMLAGHYPFAFYAILGSCLYFLFKIPTPFNDERGARKKNLFQGFIFLIISCLLGFCLSAIQTVPTLELLGLSERAGGLVYKDIIDNSFHPKTILTLIFPFFFDGFGNFDIQTRMYIGLIPLILVFISFLYKSRYRRLHVILAIISMFFALGEHNPLFKSIATIFPPINFLGRPYRLMLIAMFSLAILSAMGLDHITESSHNLRISKQTKSLLIFFFVLSGLGIVWACGSVRGTSHLDSILGFDGIVRFLTLLGAGGLFYAWINRKITARTLRQGIILFVIVDLLAFGMRHLNVFLYQKDDQRYANYKPPVLELLKRDTDKYRIFSFRTRNEAGVGLLAITNNLRYDIASINEVASIPYGLYSHYVSNIFNNSRLLGLANVKYLLSDSDIFFNANIQKIYDEEIKVYVNQDVSPRAFVVPRAKVVKTREETRAALKDPMFDFSEYVLMEEPLSQNEMTALPNDDVSARIVEETDNAIIIEAQGPGYLVLMDTFYPGWKVFVDGVQEKIYRANSAFRGVPIQQGIHTVRFVYDPFSFKVGLGLTGISTVSLCLFFASKKAMLKRGLR